MEDTPSLFGPDYTYVLALQKPGRTTMNQLSKFVARVVCRAYADGYADAVNGRVTCESGPGGLVTWFVSNERVAQMFPDEESGQVQDS
jgi:hypothetical protein